MGRLVVGILLILCSLSAYASTPAEWSKLERDAKRSCIAASDLRRPRPSDIIVFNDSAGQVALLVRGTYRQAHMKGARGTDLCLYDRRTRMPAVEDVSGWSDLRASHLSTPK